MFNILKHIPSSISKLHRNVFPVSGKGSWITDNTGCKYLDFTSGIGALSLGHSHPAVIRAVNSQVEKLVHIPQQIFETHPPQIKLTQSLLNILPPKLDTIFYTNSGSEATDNALKIARKHTGKTNIIAFQRGFHGRTIGALSVTSSGIASKFKSQPLIPGVFFCHDFEKESLDNILRYNTSPDETAAIIIEPVQGEGGVISVPQDFLKYIRQICTDHNIMMIVDEIQCGSGRTGKWWNIESKDVVPDMLNFGKGIGCGFPIAGIATQHDVMNCGANYLGGTYGGNAISSVVASTTIDVINNENILDNVNAKGKLIKSSLENEPLIKEIRQYGLMIGFEFEFSYNSSLVERLVHDLQKYCDILVLLAGDQNQYIRILPPLNINSSDTELFISRFKYALEELVK